MILPLTFAIPFTPILTVLVKHQVSRAIRRNQQVPDKNVPKVLEVIQSISIGRYVLSLCLVYAITTIIPMVYVSMSLYTVLKPTTIVGY